MPTDRALVQVEVFGDKKIMATMNAWAYRAGHAAPAYEAMHEYAMEIEKELFDTEGASGEHGAWEPHADERRSPNPILFLSGDLFNSLTDKNDENHRFVITPFGWAMGTALSYAEDIQSGTEHMPQRRLFDFTWAQRQGFVEIMAEWIARQGLVPTGSAGGFRVRATRTGRFIG